MFNTTPQLRDYSSLDERFITYFKSAERVEVIWKEGYEDYTGYGCRTNGRVARFYVSMSTGWRPVFISLLQRNSWGGSAILVEAVQDIRGLGTYLYEHSSFAHLRAIKFEAEQKLYEDNKTVFEPPMVEIIEGLNYHPVLKAMIEKKEEMWWL